MKQIPSFLDIPPELSQYENAKVAILPVPYEATVSYGKGTAKAPAAIIAASSQVEFYDDELGREPMGIGIATLDALNVAGIGPHEMAQRVTQAVAKIVSDGKMPFVLGGEHSITSPIVQAVDNVYGKVTVVQLDAHADLRQEYLGEPMSHASAMARVREISPAVQVGIRSLSKEEAEWVAREHLPMFFARDMQSGEEWMKEAIAAVPTEKVYVSVDVDVFDAAIMPATGTPEPGGLNWYQVTNFLRTLTQEKKVVGFDLVEFSPIEGMRAYDFMIAKLVYKCIGYATVNYR